jgi:hypothetical protein
VNRAIPFAVAVSRLSILPRQKKQERTGQFVGEVSKRARIEVAV